ncbi:MAG: hypothetical protein ACR2QB_01460 [Gammaproteobacteria bacterium]
MQCKPPDKQFFAEIRDLNLAFLQLVADPRAGDQALGMLAMPSASAAALQSLPPAELSRVACAPVLMARLDAPGLDAGVAETAPLPAGLDPQWSRNVSLFAAGLLTYLWQLARRQPVAASLCLGPDPARVHALARLTGRQVMAAGAVAGAMLRARRIFRAPFLPELLRAVRNDAPPDELPGLNLIPLGLAQLRPAASRRTVC